MNLANHAAILEIRAATVLRAKAQVLSDMLEGKFSKLDEIRSFSDLHECVDANYYGDAFNPAFTDMLESLMGEDESTPAAFSDVVTDFFGPVHDSIDKWIKDGGMTAAAKQVEDGVLSAWVVSAAAMGQPIQLDLQ